MSFGSRRHDVQSRARSWWSDDEVAPCCVIVLNCSRPACLFPSRLRPGTLTISEIKVLENSRIDCNANGIDDRDDLQSGVLHDENHDGVPDECDEPDWVGPTPPMLTSVWVDDQRIGVMIYLPDSAEPVNEFETRRGFGFLSIGMGLTTGIVP
jgi:hypothetical protein